MKTLITLGIALVALSQAGASTFKSTDNDQGDSKGDSLVTEQRHFAPVADQVIMNPSVVFAVNNQKTMDEVIAENNKITESNIENDGSLLFIEKSIEQIILDDSRIIEAGNTTEIHPLYLDRTEEEKIAEDNAIIEGDMTEAQPLDFETINKKQMIIKKLDGNLLIGMN
jgi:hypothetical protein